MKYLALIQLMAAPLHAYDVEAVYADYQNSLKTIVRPMEKLQARSYGRIETLMEQIGAEDEYAAARGILKTEIIPYFEQLNEIIKKGSALLKTPEVKALYAPILEHRTLLGEIAEGVLEPAGPPEKEQALADKARLAYFWESQSDLEAEKFFSALAREMAAAKMPQVSAQSPPAEGGGMLMFLGLILEERQKEQ